MKGQQVLWILLHVIAIMSIHSTGQEVTEDPLAFESSEYTASVPEEVGDPVMVTQVAVRGSVDENSSPIRFFIRNSDVPFRVDNYGVIWTRNKIDRELVSSFEIQIGAEDERGSIAFCHVLVTITDKNDNPPRFTRLFGANISESAPIGTFVIQLTSTDSDSDPAFTEATYSLIDAAEEPFEIEPHSGKVFLTANLDREGKDEYLLHVAVNDSSWRAQTTVTITVLDENDCVPKFERSHYEFKRTAASKETRVGQVKAFDSDIGVNGKIEYLIASDSDTGVNEKIDGVNGKIDGVNEKFEYLVETANDVWIINTQTGELSLTPSAVANMRHESNRRFNLTIIARDGGTPAQTGKTFVSLIITSDEVVPTVVSDQVLIPIPVDLKNDTVVYGLKSQMAIRSFRNSRVLQVIGNRIVYFGEGIVRPGDKYTFQLMSAMDEFNLTAIITFPNLHSPQFEQPKFQIIVPENREKSQLLAHFVATDGDQDNFNRDIQYSFEVFNVSWNDRASEYYSNEFSTSVLSITSPEKVASDLMSKSKETGVMNPFRIDSKSKETGVLNPFRIDSETGALYLESKLDFELITMYRIKITAQDSALFWAKNSSATVYVIVNDVNDNRPTFTNLKELSNGLEVYENNLVGHIVGEVKAIDFDSLPYSQITYSIEPVLDHSNFSISSKTGQIQALVSFDYEKKNEYSLSVVAKNDETVKRSVTLKIRVKDISNESELRSSEKVSFGVIIVVIFFVILIMVISGSFFIYNQQNDHHVNGMEYNCSTTRKMISQNNMGGTLSKNNMNGALSINLKQHLSHSGSLVHHYGHHHSVHHHAMQSQSHGNILSPDVVEQQQQQPIAHPRMPPAPPSSSFAAPSDAYSEILVAAENYDLENSSSIAPSDMDLAFRGFKGFPSRVLPPGPLSGSHHRVLPPGPLSGSHHVVHSDPRHVPLARLSPSVSELTAPRILTLHDLSPSTPSGVVTGRTVSNKLPCTRSPPTMSADSSDDDDANTIDSFTSSEYDESASCPKVKHHQNIFQRV